MTGSDSLIRHATSPIDFDSSKLHRSRLVERIQQNLSRKLIAIGAPAGYGKTTLLADFSEHSDLPVCWVRMSRVEQDVFRLAEVLAFSLQRKFRRLRGKPDLKGLAGSAPEALAGVFVDVIEEFIPEPFVLILDEIEAINHSRKALDFIDLLIRDLPEQVTVISAGREIPDISLARLMAEGDLAGLGPQDLAFDVAELTDYYQFVRGESISTLEIERIHESSRGWITGILLSSQAAEQGIQSQLNSSGMMVYDYLAGVVLENLPREMQSFLIESSVLPVMTVDSCNHILERNDSLAWLTSLIEKGLYISSASDFPRTYEYHPQFRSFLRAWGAANDPERVRLLQLKAGDYLESQGAVEHAVDLYMESERFDRAANLAEKKARQMFYQGRHETLRDWGRLFREHGVPSPAVHLYLAKFNTDQGDLTAAGKLIHEVEQMDPVSSSQWFQAQLQNQKALIALRKQDYAEAWERALEAGNLSQSQEDNQILASSLRIQAYCLFMQKTDLQEAEALALKAVRCIETDENDYDLALVYSDLAAIQASQGKVLESQKSGHKAHRILVEKGAPVPLALSYNNMAYYSHLRGEYEEALQLYRSGLKQARRGASPAREANILFGIADLFSDLGLIYQAGENYARGLDIAASIDSPALIMYGCLGTGILHRRNGNGNLPHQWLQRAVLHGAFSDTPASIRIQIAALERVAAASSARHSLESMLENEAYLNALERTTAWYFYIRLLLDQELHVDAVEQFLQLLDWASGYGTEQILAAEMLSDNEMAEFFSLRLSSHSAYDAVYQRMERMRAFARQFLSTTGKKGVPPGLSVTVLGVTSLQMQSEVPVDLKPLDREILIFLLDRHRVDRDVLLENFWPDASPANQVASLYTAIYNLRQALGKDAVLLEDSMYRINPEYPLEFDLYRFDRTATIAEQLMPGDPRRYFALTEAVGSYRGTFFIESNSDWVLERRRSLEKRYLELLLSHSEEALLHDHAVRAVESIRIALVIDPYRDDLNYRYLEALGRLERRSEISAHYQQYLRLLSNDLGLDPSESVSRLYTTLLG